MRQIGSIASETEATSFGDYLLTLGIPNEVDYSEASGAWDIWVEKDDDLERGATELATFTANPADERYGAALKQAQAVRAEQAKAEARRRKNFIDVRTRASTPNQWNVPLTIFLITAAVVVSVLTHLGQDSASPTADALRFSGVLHYVSVEGRQIPVLKPGFTSIVHDKQIWRLVTPIFLHYGFLHLLFNLFWIRDLGAMIETRRGTWFMLLLVLLIAAISNVAEFCFDNRGNIAYGMQAYFGGLSGVVYGLFGYAWIRGRVDPGGAIGVRNETAILMIVWLFACMSGALGPIANTAHVAGLLVGVAFAYGQHGLKQLLRLRR